MLPLDDEGYVLNKKEFRDAFALRCNKFIPNQCPCAGAAKPRGGGGIGFMCPPTSFLG